MLVKTVSVCAHDTLLGRRTALFSNLICANMTAGNESQLSS